MSTVIVTNRPVPRKLVPHLLLTLVVLLSISVPGAYGQDLPVRDGADRVLSDPMVSAYVAYTVEPNDLVLPSGSMQHFTLFGIDPDGNSTELIDAVWSVSPGSEALGRFAGNEFYSQKTGSGQIVANLSGSVVASTTLQVEPGALARIDLTISPDQVASEPFQTDARMSLFDENNNLVTDYDLAANPIQLVPDTGSLVPSIRYIVRRGSQ